MHRSTVNCSWRSVASSMVSMVRMHVWGNRRLGRDRPEQPPTQSGLGLFCFLLLFVLVCCVPFSFTDSPPSVASDLWVCDPGAAALATTKHQEVRLVEDEDGVEHGQLDGAHSRACNDLSAASALAHDAFQHHTQIAQKLRYGVTWGVMVCTCGWSAPCAALFPLSRQCCVHC